MDFAITPEQQDLKALVARIFDERVDAEQLPDYDVGQDWFDRDLWKALADSQLLGVALAEEVGGAGLGFEELWILLEEAGRTLFGATAGSVQHRHGMTREARTPAGGI